MHTFRVWVSLNTSNLVGVNLCKCLRETLLISYQDLVLCREVFFYFFDLLCDSCSLLLMVSLRNKPCCVLSILNLCVTFFLPALLLFPPAPSIASSLNTSLTGVPRV